MNLGLFLVVEWGRAVGVKLECGGWVVATGGGGGGGGLAVRGTTPPGWLAGCCGVTLYFDTGGQRSRSPGGAEKVANWGRFIQQ